MWWPGTIHPAKATLAGAGNGCVPIAVKSMHAGFSEHLNGRSQHAGFGKSRGAWDCAST